MNARIPIARKGRANRAFTLVEVMVATVIGLAMIVSILSLFNFNFIYQNQQELRANAMDAMVTEMESLKQQFMWRVAPTEIFISDNRTPGTVDDDTIGRLIVDLYTRDGTKLTEAPKRNFDRLRVVMTVEWNGRGRLSSRIFKERLVAYLIP